MTLSSTLRLYYTMMPFSICFISAVRGTKSPNVPPFIAILTKASLEREDFVVCKSIDQSASEKRSFELIRMAIKGVTVPHVCIQLYMRILPMYITPVLTRAQTIPFLNPPLQNVMQRRVSATLSKCI